MRYLIFFPQIDRGHPNELFLRCKEDSWRIEKSHADIADTFPHPYDRNDPHNSTPDTATHVT